MKWEFRSFPRNDTHARDATQGHLNATNASPSKPPLGPLVREHRGLVWAGGRVGPLTAAPFPRSRSSRRDSPLLDSDFVGATATAGGKSDGGKSVSPPGDGRSGQGGDEEEADNMAPGVMKGTHTSAARDVSSHFKLFWSKTKRAPRQQHSRQRSIVPYLII